GQIKVEVPLSGVDPDGDSVQMLGFPAGPALGSIKEMGADYFIYEASAAGTGTDTFRYEVFDAFGATGLGEIKIAVIPEPADLQNPVALPDRAAIRPGRLAQVDVLSNDSDPQGAPVTASKKLLDVPKGISAEMRSGRYLVLKAPSDEQSFTLRYEITNGRGGTAVSYVLVEVTADAPL